MSSSKPGLVLQLHPEDHTSDNDLEAFLKYGQLDEADTRRIRIENTGMPELSLEDYPAVSVGGSPFDISTPQERKSVIQVRIESDFRRLFVAAIYCLAQGRVVASGGPALHPGQRGIFAHI